MSEPIPESVPTSSNSSRRPVKKQRLNDPISQQAATVHALFAKPDQEIKLPSSSSLTTHAQRAVPEIVSNVQGSSAGAGSGEFHVYKASRRREYERLRMMDEEVEKEREDERFEREREERRRRDEEETARRRRKREGKRKGKGGKGGAKGKGGKGGAKGVEGQNSRVLARAETAAGGEGGEKDVVEKAEGQPEAEVAKQEVGLVICDDD